MIDSKGRYTDKLRSVRLSPYRKGFGPSFTLTMWARPDTDWRGQTLITYEFKQHLNGKTAVLFEGSDFAGSPLHADDSDETVASLLTFLTLRVGDTDSEYFEDYNEAQHAFADEHAETLQAYCSARFGDR